MSYEVHTDEFGTTTHPTEGMMAAYIEHLIRLGFVCVERIDGNSCKIVIMRAVCS
jgi:hypothetical protein